MALRSDYFGRYGTTLGGLLAEREVDAWDFLAFVHNIPVEAYVRPNPALRAMLNAIPLRRVIYTSGTAGGASGNTAAGAGNLLETLSLPAASSVTYTVDCTIDPGASGTLSNTATISGTLYDPNPGNNSANDTDLYLVCADGPDATLKARSLTNGTVSAKRPGTRVPLALASLLIRPWSRPLTAAAAAAAEAAAEEAAAAILSKRA